MHTHFNNFQNYRDLDSEIGTVVRGQQNVADKGRLALEQSQHTILQLSAQIRDIKEKADRSESMVIISLTSSQYIFT